MAEKAEKPEKTPLTKERLLQATQIFRYVLPFKWPFILGMLSLAIGSLLFLAIMYIPGELLNVLSGDTSSNITVNQLFLVVLAFLGFQSFLSFWRVKLFAIVSEKSMALLRSDLYTRLIGLPIQFFEQRRVGELTSRLTNDIAQVQNVVSITLAEFIRQIIVLIGGIGIIVFTMPRLALTMLLTFPVVVIGAMFFGRYIRKLMKARQDKLAETNVVVEETMQSIQTVKAYTNEWFEVSRYSEKLQEAVQIALKAAGMRGLFAAFIIFVMFGALFFIMWRAALMVQSGVLESGDLVHFVVYTGTIGASIAGLGSFYAEIVSSIGATERIFDILEETPEIEAVAASSTEAAFHFKGAITYQNIQFSYPTRPDIEVLKGIDLHIAPGTKVALVGSSGSGKTTMVALLQRFYDYSEGQITIDGKDIREYPLTAYRRNLAIVPQEVLLFGGTIGENIRYGKPNANDEELIEAAKQANAWDFISSFPEGLDTIVGERGVKLSGGQRQRVAIARAILKDPAILLLDEATSSLDAESERVVQEALNNLMEGRTSIIIAHRLSTIREVDCIYVIDNGRIVEQGTHDELSQREDGIYNNLAKLQFELSE
ncbi:MAG: multidrug ABC transporter ATP-binding protein [Bacteroidetes bacterium]|nr:MAG: multidrug ABC transporter ATP-binding protein [Bacteroidota bacterium]PTM11261.1 MAG: multidrug ABC transporter ATP-binding protein [Bacteroidota bacterium]